MPTGVHNDGRLLERAKLFNTTHWTVVRRAQDDSLSALNHLFTQYREPLIRHLAARSNVSRDQAEESVQGFCAHLLKRDFLAKVTAEKGRFRTFLLTALDHYLHDQREHARAIKRGNGQPVVSLDEADPDGDPLWTPASKQASADVEYDRHWADAVLANALRRLEEEAAASGRAALCRALEPALFEDEKSSSYREIAEELGLSEGVVKMAAHRLRQRLRGLIREEVRQTVGSEAELEGELAYLISLFSKS